jgi:cell division protein FtsQ
VNRPQGALRSRGVGARRGRARSRSRGRRLRLPRVPPRVLIAMVVVVALLAGAWLWLRDSSLVAVRRVAVTGVSGPDASQIRSALVASAKDMTTLDVQVGHLRTVVAPYPVVKNLQVSTQFPHGMRIRVIEQVPVAVVVAAGAHTAVSADGTLLPDAVVSSSLPAIDMGVAPGGTHVTGLARGQVRLLAAAPYAWLAKIGQVSTDPIQGLVAQLRNGPAIYFGAADQLSAKWQAAAQVLADPTSAGASYVDVSDPARPAAGPGSDSSTTSASSSSATSGSGSTTAQ